MTGANFLAYVKKVFKRSDKDTELYECITDVVVDMHLRLLSDSASYEATIELGLPTVGDFVMSVPSDFGHLLTDGLGIRDSATDEDYCPLRKISKERYDELYSQNSNTSASNRDTGLPLHYCYFGKQIFVGPAVDKTTYVFKLNYTTDGVEDITSATTSVPFTDKYRKIVRDGVLALMYKMLENFGEAESFQADYELGLGKIQANDDYNDEEFEPMHYRRY